MVRAPTIAPSARPLPLCLAGSAMCALPLTVGGVTLLAIWRRPSRPWRLGLAMLGAGMVGVVVTGRTRGARGARGARTAT